MSKYVVLVVDDNSNNRLSLRSLIREDFDNVEVLEADSGITALSLLMKKIVDLIILDIQMPQMDGFETAKMIQSRTRTRHVPIVFLTAAYKSDEFKKKGFEAGAVDYLTKPIEPEQLSCKINTYLRLIEKKPAYDRSELEIEQKVKEQLSKFSDSSLQKNIGERMDKEHILKEIQASIKVIIGYNKILETEATDLGYHECLPEVQKVGFKLNDVIDVIQKELK